MAPADNVQHRLRHKTRGAPAAFGGAGGMGGCDIEPGQRLRGGGDGMGIGNAGGHQFLEMRLLGGECAATGLGDAAGLLMQGEGIEAHGPRHGLAVGKAAVGSHQRLGPRGGHLDEIAQHTVVADFQRGHAGFVAIFRLQRGDGPAGMGGDMAQIVEIGVIARRDKAALPALGWRRGHQRGGKQGNQSLMPAQMRHQPGEQIRQQRLARQHLAQVRRPGEAIAQLAKVARGTTPGHHPAQRPADIGQGAQGAPDVVAQQGAIVQPLHQRQPGVDGGNIGERGGQIVGQQPRAGACDAAIHHLDQAALSTIAPRAILRGQNLQAGAGGLVHQQMARARAGHRRQQQPQPPAPDMLQIGDQPACRRQHRAGEAAKAIQRRHAVQRAQPGRAIVAGKIARRAQGGAGGGQLPALGRDDLAGAQPGPRRG